MFKCEVIDSNSDYGLNKHFRTKHINMPKNCKYCEDSFDLKANLNNSKICLVEK